MEGPGNISATLMPFRETELKLQLSSMPDNDEPGLLRLLRFSLAGISISVNLLVIFVILYSRQLHAPRHVYWVGISFTMIFFSLGFIAQPFSGNRVICVLNELGIGLWYPSLLLFLSLAGWDRCLAVQHYEWYKNSMTNKRAIFAMVTTFVLNAVITESPYWTGLESLFDCSANLAHTHWIYVWNLLLSLINVYLQVRLFKVSRKFIKEYSETYPRQPIRFTARNYSSANSSAHHSYPMQVGDERKPVNREGVKRHVLPRRINQLDFRAALVMSVNMLPFWLFTLPPAGNIVAFYWCLRLQYSCPTAQMMRAHICFKYFFVVPCIFLPIAYVWNCGEVRRAVRRLLGKVKTSTTNHTISKVPPRFPVDYT